MTDAWVRSPRLGKPEALSEIIDLLRGVRDYLRVVDPLAQGLATAAELEARLLEIFQAASVPRTLGLLLAQLLVEFIRPYLTDGVYFLQHHNLREIVERTGIAPLLDPLGRYTQEADLQRLAGAEGEKSAFVRFGVDSSGGLLTDYDSYPQVIEGQAALAERSLIRTAVGDLLENAGQFDAFGDWLNPILAAFYDVADPKRPVAGPDDKLGGLLFAVTGTDPIEVYRKFLRLQKAFSKISEIQFDLDEALEDLEGSLGLDTLEQWRLLDSLQYGGLQLYLRPHLVPRYGTLPDFSRLSTADLLPFMSNLLVDATNLVDFAGLPYPENFALFEQAQRMADQVRDILAAFDETLDLITQFSDALDIAEAWRLVLTPETGGVDGLVERIRTATRDDMVRLTGGTISSRVSSSGGITLVETRLGRITSLPADTSGIPEYTGQVVGDFVEHSTLSALSTAFADAGRSGFRATEARVWRAGELLRRSEFTALQRAYPGVSSEEPGNLIIFGVGMFFVEGALSRLLLSIFTPTEEEAAGGVVVPDIVSDRSDLFDLDMTSPAAAVRTLIPGGPALSQVLSAEGGNGDPSSSRGGSSEDSSFLPNPQRVSIWDGMGGGRSEIEGAPGTVHVQSNAVLSTRWAGTDTRVLGARSTRMGVEMTPIHSASRLTAPRAALDRMLTREAPARRGGESIELPPHGWVAGPQSFVEGEFDIDPLLEADDLTESLTDLTIAAGGTRVVSAQLRAWVLLTGLFAGENQMRRALDVTLTMTDGRLTTFRTWMVENYSTDAVVVQPALPLSGRVSPTPVAARASLVDAPGWRLNPTVPEDVLSTDSVTFEATYGWLRSFNLDTRDLAARPKATLEVCAGGHIVDGETHTHAEWSAVQVAWDGSGFVVFAAEEDLEDVRTLVYLDSDPPRLFQTLGVGTSGDPIELLPRDDAAAVARDAQNAAVTLWALKPTEPSAEEPTTHLPTLTGRASLQGRAFLGVPNNGVVSYSDPGEWSHIEMLSGSTVVVVDVVDALNLPTPDAGYSGVTAWELSFKAGFLLMHGASQLCAVLNPDPSHLSAYLLPFLCTDEDDYLEPEDGDAILVGFQGHARAGIAPRRLFAAAGGDPDQVPGALRITLPGSAGIGLRPAGAQSGVVTLSATFWAATEYARQGEHTLLECMSYRVGWEPTGLTQVWRLYKKGRTEGSALVGAMTLPRWQEGQEFELRLAYLEDDQEAVLQVGVSGVMLAEVRGAAITPLEGLRAAGGTWCIGSSRLDRPVLDAVWSENDSEDGVVFGAPPILFPSMTFQSSGQAVVESILWESAA